MLFRIAQIEDLKAIQDTFQLVVQEMLAQEIIIWDDVYPRDFFHEDIIQNNLYVLEDHHIIVAAFALTNENHAMTFMNWKDPLAKACYLSRLGVHPAYARKGIAMQMVEYACQVAKERAANYLRLFVVDYNIPAIKLYHRLGFNQVDGQYIESFEHEDVSFCEIGFEKPL